MILNFQDLNLSETKSNSRLAAAESALGKRTVERILAFSCYLSGAPRQDIAPAFNYTVPGMNSFVRRLYEQGPEAFSQTQGPRRPSEASTSEPNPETSGPTKSAEIVEAEIDNHVMNLKINAPTTLRIPFDPIRATDQIFALKCQNAGLLTLQQAANFLNKTPNQIQHMRRKMKETGGVEAVLDQRLGQQKSYKFTEKAQSELLYALFEDLVESRSISSIRLHDKIEKRLSLGISDRTIRTYLDGLGLPHVKARLIELVKKKIPHSRGGR